MEQTYHELYLRVDSNYADFIDFIFTLGYEAIEEKDGDIIVRSNDDMEMLRFALNEFATKMSLATQHEIQIKTDIKVKKNEDWIKKYQESIKPISVGNFYIRPDWEAPDDEKQNIIINPALAFGSGHHESTYGCILQLQNYLQKDDTLLDVGCGSGILSIVAAKLGAVVDLCDTDEQAIESAQENFKLNHVNYHEAWVGSVNFSHNTYDVVVANIIADVLVMLSQDLIKHVKPGGVLILSGILDKYVDKVHTKFQQMELVEKYKRNEWYTLVLKR
ncbi:50S ribosomal protein L11 methyltransferase [Sulfurospirillum sp. 1612]|uniref:50S ribosomal protein L11 methyltransferase n=1 Tax=Sulfurospirillum sp. 1612 TaxID=3094835 RepID=UPI002F92442F